MTFRAIVTYAVCPIIRDSGRTFPVSVLNSRIKSSTASNTRNPPFLSASASFSNWLTVGVKPASIPPPAKASHAGPTIFQGSPRSITAASAFNSKNPSDGSMFQSKLIDCIPDILRIHYLGGSAERIHQLQKPRLEHRKQLSQASLDEHPVLYPDKILEIKIPSMSVESSLSRPSNPVTASVLIEENQITLLN